MSFSFVMIDKKNTLDISSINSFINQNYSDYEILYCSPKNGINDANIRHFAVNDNDKIENIINSVVCKTTKQNIVVIRKFVGNQQLKNLTNALKSPDAIAFYKKEYKGIKKVFCNIMKKLAKFLYGREIIFASHAMVAYSENPSLVLKELDNPSAAMRKFSWTGYINIECGIGENYKLEYKKTSIALKTLLSLVIVIGLLVVYVLFRTKIPMLWEMVMILTILIGLALFVIYGTNWFIKSQIGENVYIKSENINN